MTFPDGRKILVRELTHLRQNKDGTFITHKAKEKLEAEVEQAERIEKYNPDTLIIKRIHGVEYRYRKSV